MNNNDGWTVVRWYKRGLIKDKSLIEARNNNSSSSNDETVGSGQLSYHIVEVLPSNQDILDANIVLGVNLNALKYAVSILNHA